MKTLTITTDLADELWLPVGGVVLPEVGETVALTGQTPRRSCYLGEDCDDTLCSHDETAIVGSGTVAEVLPIGRPKSCGMGNRRHVCGSGDLLAVFDPGDRFDFSLPYAARSGDWSPIEPCPTCNGQGWFVPSEVAGVLKGIRSDCWQCNGRGTIRRHVIHLTGVAPVEERCPKCGHHRIGKPRHCGSQGCYGFDVKVIPVTPPADAGDVWEWHV